MDNSLQWPYSQSDSSVSANSESLGSIEDDYGHRRSARIARKDVAHAEVERYTSTTRANRERRKGSAPCVDGQTDNSRENEDSLEYILWFFIALIIVVATAQAAKIIVSVGASNIFKGHDGAKRLH